VIGISADDAQTAERFRASLELPFPVLGDPDGRILSAYKVRWPLVGLAQRVSYVIGRDRRVRHAYRSELDAESHVAEACAVVAAPRG